MRTKTLVICRAAVIAALYVALTIVCGPLAFNSFLQFRPAEALTMLPLIFPEAVPGLFVGCLLSNIFSQFGLYDVIFGSLITLCAASLSYIAGKFIKNKPLKLAVGGLFPVALNAFLLPAIWYFAAGDVGYWVNCLSTLATQTLYVYALGVPLYFMLERFKNSRFLR